MLEFSLAGQTLSRLDDTQVVGDSQNYLECAFQFGIGWASISPVAVFGHKNVPDPISVPIRDGYCMVPEEVIGPPFFTMAVYGSGHPREDKLWVHLPTDVVTVEVLPSGTGEGLTPPEPTPSLYDSLMAAIAEAEEEVTVSRVRTAVWAQTAMEAAEAAQYARNGAADNELAAQHLAQQATEDALSAQRAAALAQTAAQSLDGLGAAMADLRTDLDRLFFLTRSYVFGVLDTEEYRRWENIGWSSDGSFTTSFIGLQAGVRYILEANGECYDGIAYDTHLPNSPGGPASSFGEGEEVAPLEEEEPSADPLRWGNGFRPETPGGDEVGDQVDLNDPVYTSRTVKLTAGPVTIYDTWNGTVAEQWQERCQIYTRDRTVTTLVLRGDSRDNARYYMNQAKAARDQALQAQTACESIYQALTGPTGGNG